MRLAAILGIQESVSIILVLGIKLNNLNINYDAVAIVALKISRNFQEIKKKLSKINFIEIKIILECYP